MASSVDLTSFPTARNNATESSYAQMAVGYQGNGVIWNIGNSLAGFADSTGMHVKLPSGRVVVNGTYGDSTSQQQLDVATADATNPRIDRVVARLTTTSPATVSLKVLTGTAAPSPVPPALANDATHVDSPIMQVRVNATASTITSGNVTLERVFTGDTGWFDYTATWSALSGSDFSISGQVPHVARARHVGMTTTVYILADVAVFNNSNPTAVNGTVLVSLPWPALYDQVPIFNDFHSDVYRAKTRVSSGTLIDSIGINPQANQTFVSDGVARSASLAGSFELRPF